MDWDAAYPWWAIQEFKSAGRILARRSEHLQKRPIPEDYLLAGTQRNWDLEIILLGKNNENDNPSKVWRQLQDSQHTMELPQWGLHIKQGNEETVKQLNIFLTSVVLK